MSDAKAALQRFGMSGAEALAGAERGAAMLRSLHTEPGKRVVVPVVDVYRVGALDQLWRVYRVLNPRVARQLRARGLRGFRRAQLRRTASKFRQHWRRRSFWNGYLAEPTPTPYGLRTIGHGWTRRRALARLGRCLYEVGR